jgi:hypothetical protein
VGTGRGSQFRHQDYFGRYGFLSGSIEGDVSFEMLREVL